MADDQSEGELPQEPSGEQTDTGVLPNKDGTETEAQPQYDMSGQSEIDKETGVADQRDYTEQLKNQYQTDLKRAEAHSHEQQQFIDHFQQSIANTPKPPQMMQQQMPQAAQAAKGQLTTTVFQVLAILATAFSSFGSRRNNGSHGAVLAGIGALFNGIAQGRMQQVKTDQVKWHQLNESILQENKQRTQEYKDILSNRRLDLNQQMELMRMKAQFYKDQKMESDAAKKDLGAIYKNIKSKDKANDHHMKNTPMGDSDHQAWRELVLEKSQGKADINTPEGRSWAWDNYPFSRFLNEKNSKPEKDPNTGTIPDKFSGKQPQKQEKSDYEKHMDSTYGPLPTNEDGDRVYQKLKSEQEKKPSKSVLEKPQIADPDSGDEDTSGSGE